MKLVLTFKGCLLAAFMTPMVTAATITVDDDGPADYSTIQEAVDAANPGDTILVAPGLYEEEVFVPVSVTIIGSGIGETLVVPATSRPGSGPGSQLDTTAWVFRVAASNVTIASLSILGDNPNIGGAVDARGGVITDFLAGSFDNLAVSATEVDGVAHRGLYAAAGGTGHQFFSNVVKNITQNPLDSVGIFFFGGTGDASSNVIQNCSVGLGFQASGGGNFADNQISGCDLAILTNQSTTPVTIAGNVIQDCDQGIQSVNTSTTIAIDENEVQDCDYGIVCFGLGSGTNMVTGNSVDGAMGAGRVGLIATTDVTPFGFGDVHVVAKGNEFVANDWGVVLNEPASDSSYLLDASFSNDPADYNIFSDNATFNVLLENVDEDVDARFNFWGVAEASRIEDSIYHQVDDPTLGLVDFSDPVNLIVTVDDDGGADYLEINPAIQAVWPGGTVQVFPGFYQEDVEIDRPLYLAGAGSSSDASVSTVILSSGSSPTESVVAVAADGVVIENIHVNGTVPSGDFKIRRGIYGSSVDSLTIRDCVVHTAVSAIAYVSSTNGLFLRNEIHDFGRSLNEGGGIFCWGSTARTGSLGDGNYVHHGLATGIIFHQSSSGIAEGNRASLSPLGFLCNGCAADTTIRGNEVTESDQGFQSIANNFPILYEDNIALSCLSGFTLFPLGNQLHTYVDNYVDGKGVGKQGVFVTTSSVFGDSDVHASFQNNVFVGSTYGARLDETVASSPFVMNVNFSGASGANVFAASGTYDIFMDQCNDEIDARENQFATSDASEIEDRVFHENDDPTLGLVRFSGFRDYGPELRLAGGFEQNYQVAFLHIGLPNQQAFAFYALDTSVTSTPFGDLLLDPLTLSFLFRIPIGPTGVTRVDFEEPYEVPPGFSVYFQSFVTEPGPPPAQLTNVVEAITR